MKFKGTENYVATQDLMLAVNAAITLKRPRLVKGEPGTGKTMLAEEVAQALGLGRFGGDLVMLIAPDQPSVINPPWLNALPGTGAASRSSARPS